MTVNIDRFSDECTAPRGFNVYDISNKRRLGRSEVDLVQDMYNGVKAMIAKEKELGGGA